MRHLTIHISIGIFSLVALSPLVGQASEYRQTDRFAATVERTLQYANEFGHKRVLMVLDIDNTLLAMNRELGSDQWFEWQEYLLEHQPDSPHLVAHDFAGLLEVQGILFATGRMHPPEFGQPAQIAVLQELGIPMVAMTARGDEFRAATVGELQRNGYRFGPHAPRIRLLNQPDKGPRETCSRFIPYVAGDPHKSGISGQEFRLFGLSSRPRQISYGDGVYMLSGQHKGAMLLILMHLIDDPFDAVVFVDDNGKNTTRVYDALVRRDIEVAAFHYTREEARVAHFAYGNKQAVSEAWRRIARALEREPTRADADVGQ